MSLESVLEQATKAINRRPRTTCSSCGGKGKIQEETYEGGWDRTWRQVICPYCSGQGLYGGGQPGLTLYFETTQQRDKVKRQLLRMASLQWNDEGDNVMEGKAVLKS